MLVCRIVGDGRKTRGVNEWTRSNEATLSSDAGKKTRRKAGV